MTIVAGFNCTDGVLLASDSLYSGAVQNTYGQKLWIVRKKDPLVVFGGSGTVGALLRARREIKRVVRDGMAVNNALDAIDEALRTVDNKFPSRYEQKHVQALVAIRTKDEIALFQNISGEVALSPVDAPSVCLGVDTLGNYFTSLLYSVQMPLKWAKAVAAHLVWNCKAYASGYCGGPTRLIAIPVDGAPDTIEDQDTILELEKQLAPIHAVVQLVLPRQDESDDATRERKERLNQAIETIQKGLRFVVATPQMFSNRLSQSPYTIIAPPPITLLPTALPDPTPPTRGRKRQRPSRA
jgi:hypothetical protein